MVRFLFLVPIINKIIIDIRTADYKLKYIYSAAPTAPPEDLLAAALDSRTLHIRWQPPAEEDRNGIIRRYVINVTELYTGTNFELESTNTETTLPNLHPFYQYSCSVAAETVALGPSTPGVTIEMPEDGNFCLIN